MPLQLVYCFLQKKRKESFRGILQLCKLKDLLCYCDLKIFSSCLLVLFSKGRYSSVEEIIKSSITISTFSQRGKNNHHFLTQYLSLPNSATLSMLYIYIPPPQLIGKKTFFNSELFIFFSWMDKKIYLLYVIYKSNDVAKRRIHDECNINTAANDPEKEFLGRVDPCAHIQLTFCQYKISSSLF